jgi:hypothetical protein
MKYIKNLHHTTKISHLNQLAVKLPVDNLIRVGQTSNINEKRNNTEVIIHFITFDVKTF